MFLKRLDILGFKSFAERISIDFVQGVTAVVGPNGSGKSNVTDAIRWVLGEQSVKSLRGSRMEDVIFIGSDAKKPLNMAEVTLTLDNEDKTLPIEYQEVSVTRRVYRSGDSDFFINKQACRLKDIVDLFMDSGLGREAFSIISQGKVEEILSSKAEDRRTIFEEAAGVLKYKNRKKKAEVKLNEVQENLYRIEDILHELSQQVEPLRTQAEVAEEYIEKKIKLEEYDIAITVYEIETANEKYEHLTKILEHHKKDEQTISEKLVFEEGAVERLRLEVATFDESIDVLQQTLLLASEELEKLEGRKEVLKERKKNAERNKKQLQITITELSTRLEKLVNHERAERQTVLQLKQQLENVQEQLLNQQTVLETFDGNVEEKIEQLKSEYIQLVHEQATYKNERTNVEAMLARMSTKQQTLSQRNEQFIKERTHIHEQVTQLTKRMSILEIAIQQAEKVLQQTKQENEQQTVTYSEQLLTLSEADHHIKRLQSKKELLLELQQDYAGFFQGVKEVLKMKKEIGGIHGAVAELIHVPTEFEGAIEIALGGSLQHIVTDDEQSARKAIQFLKERSLGRATFLPLQVIQAKTIQTGALRIIEEHPQVIGVASDLIQSDKEYTKVVKNLLGTVIVAKDLKGANELARKLDYRYRIVTIAGDVVNVGGAMTGGASNKKSSSLLARNRELDELENKIANATEKIENRKQQVAQLEDERNETLKQIETTKEQLTELTSQLQEVKTAFREVELKKQNVNEQLSLFDAEREIDGMEAKEWTGKRKETDIKLNYLTEQLQAIDKEIKRLSARKVTEQTSKETVVSTITDLKISVAQLEQQWKSGQMTLQRIVLDKKETNKKFSDTEEDLQMLVSEMDNSSENQEQLEQLRTEKKLIKQNTTTHITSRREQRLTTYTELEKLEQQVKEQTRQQKQLVDTIQDEEIKVTRLDMELENALKKLSEEHSLSFEAAKENYKLQTSIDDARKKSRLIKRAIDELGNVNLGAIEEYARVFERHEFLNGQKVDLEQAKDTLHQVISEMDEEMKKRFETVFTQIRSQFSGVFQHLFGGGHADLILTNKEDLLNTGVNIVAQPPGKKLQQLSLLSGGERSLTAIALLFSILKVRPVPFCVLDEVEAALDEANVARYARYLRDFSKETQFIVITHRKGTMEEADVLYGVTMQKSGISKLVSVRLDD